VSRDETGLAIVESVVLGTVLLVPVIWLLTVLSSVHAAALGTNSAVREAGHLVSRTMGEADRSEVEAVVAQALRNHGVEDVGRISLEASRGYARGSEVELSVSYDVPVFDAPFLKMSWGPSVTVVSRHTARIDPYRSR
jgi:hypothetical protein